MKKTAALALLIMSLLSGCAASNAPVEPTPSPEPTPDPTATPIPPVVLGEETFDTRSVKVDLSDAAGEIDGLVRALIDNSALLPSVREIDLGERVPDHGLYTGLCAAYPEAEISLSLTLSGETLDKDAESLDLPDFEPGRTEELLRVLPYLEQLREISFVSEDGVCAYSLMEIGLLDRVREAAPDVYLKVCFDLFGKKVSSEDERIEYYRVEIGNEGVDTVRAVLPYLRSCTYFLMDGCGVDNEVMAQLREDFPETKIVWRVWLIDPYYNSPVMMRRGSALTDTERLRTTLLRPTNCDVLKYCNETKYVDFGHNWTMSDYYFFTSMPKLEVCIIAISHVTDLTPLASCPELEYLEVFTTDITNVEPLANCKKLEYLNIANCKKLTDITPLYELTSLKVLRMVVTPKVPKEQKQELARRLPDCVILDQGGDPTSNGWRGTKRYALLCQQMKYAEDWLVYGIP